MTQVQKPSIGRIVRYATIHGEVVAGIVTAVFGESAVNAHLFRDGVNQEHIDTHVYTVEYAPIDPTGRVVPNTWHWPERG